MIQKMYNLVCGRNYPSYFLWNEEELSLFKNISLLSPKTIKLETRKENR